MKRIQRAVALLLFFLILLSSDRALANEDQSSASPSEEISKTTSLQEQDAEGAVVQQKGTHDEDLCKQIRDTYKAAKKRSRRKSFKGYCGAYVANQLVVLGVNTSYLSANGKNTYDIYRKMNYTSGGYGVTAYSASKYTLMEALKAIQAQDPAATDILVGFQKGVSKAGKKYGHVLLIHGIRNGKVYYSDSCDRTVEGVTYKEGEPIVCSLATFADFYAKYKLDGVIHFKKMVREKKRPDIQTSITADTTVSSSETLPAQG